MDNLHFLPNNILTKFFKELTKYKNDYISIVFKLYIYIYIYRNYTIHLNMYSLRPTLFVLFEKSNFLREHHLLSCLPLKNV